MQIVNLVVALLFAAGAVVQYNDPDPWGWIVLYIGAMLSAILWSRFERAWVLAAITGGVAVVWSALIWAKIPASVSLPEMFQPMETKGGAVEMAREIGGLLIVASWMLFLCWRSRKQKR